MIDGGWLTPGTPMQWVESLFSARNVPCVTIHGADGRRVCDGRQVAVGRVISYLWRAFNTV
jgi:hypothetical protein